MTERENRIKFYKRKRWKDIRLRVLERDFFECQRCNFNWVDPKYPKEKREFSKANTVHHILPLEMYPELAEDEDNLVSLCPKCHNVVEGRDWNFKYREPKKQLNEEKW